jgi:hypothetical protein
LTQQPINLVAARIPRPCVLSQPCRVMRTAAARIFSCTETNVAAITQRGQRRPGSLAVSSLNAS